MKGQLFDRRRFLQVSAATAGALTLGRGFAAEKYPDKSITGLVPFAPGGGTDRSARIVTQIWGEKLGIGQNGFRLDNKPGAGSLVAQDLMARAEPDGYTIMFIPEPYVAWLSILQKDRFKESQLAWIGSYFQDPNVLLVPKNSPYKTAQEFIDAARKSSRPFTAAVSAPMSASHAATVVISELGKCNLKIVPFKGGGPARNAVAGGHVDCCLAPYWSATNVAELTRGLCIFWPKDPTTEFWNAPPADQVLDFKVPHLSEPYSVAVSVKVKEQHPDRYQRLVETFVDTIKSDEFKNAAKTQGLLPFVDVWNPDQCSAFITEYLDLLHQYYPAMQKSVESL